MLVKAFVCKKDEDAVIFKKGTVHIHVLRHGEGDVERFKDIPAVVTFVSGGETLDLHYLDSYTVWGGEAYRYHLLKGMKYKKARTRWTEVVNDVLKITVELK